MRRERGAACRKRHAFLYTGYVKVTRVISVSMSDLDKIKVWNSTFGKAWEVLTKTYPFIGGFMLIRKDHKAMLDDSVPEILGFRGAFRYHDLYEAIINTNDDMPYRVIFVDENESYISGFVVSRK